MSSQTAISDIERAEHLGVGAGTGVKRVSIYNNGVQSNVATEETLQSIGGFNIPKFDQILATYPDTSTEVYTYKLAGTTVGTITVIYSDAVTKSIITSVTLS